VIDRETPKDFSSVNGLKKGYRVLLQALDQREIDIDGIEFSFVKEAKRAEKQVGSFRTTPCSMIETRQP
jgi:hypothetical protein